MQTGSGLRRDILSAYIVTAARVASWLIVTAVIIRVAGRSAFAWLALIQSTVGILEYAAIGLSPAIIRETAEAMRADRLGGSLPAPGTPGDGQDGGSSNHEPLPVIDYDSPPPAKSAAVLTVYANGFIMALLTVVGGAILLAIFLGFFRFSDTNRQSGGAALELVTMVGLSTLIRLLSDAAGAALQTSGKIFLDNVLLTIHEAIWAGGTVIDLLAFHLPWQRATGCALLAGSIVLLVLRAIYSHIHGSGLFKRWWTRFDPDLVRRLLVFGGMVVAAQMADYLYAPANYLLITYFINRDTLAIYTPAVQIDGGALLLASALASVLLPRTALAHAAGEPARVKVYYIRGTLAAFFLLLLAAPILLFLAPFIFRLWLGNPMLETCAILRLVLIHTVIGGSSAVGRAVLLAIGKVRPFTISVLIAGIGNVLLGITFAYFFHMGLKGIILGTIIAVTARCALWLPWYTLHVLNRQGEPEEAAILETIPPGHIS